MFEEEDALPSTQGQLATMNGDDFARASERHAKVTGAVVGSFVSVYEVGEILWYEVVEKRMKIGPRFGIGVLHNHEAGAGVSYKSNKLPGLNIRLGKKLFER